jgi:hypothetical protein
VAICTGQVFVLAPEWKVCFFVMIEFVLHFYLYGCHRIYGSYNNRLEV